MKPGPAIWTVRTEGRKLAAELQAGLKGTLLPVPRGAAGANRRQFATAYPKYRRWVLVMTTGIAVRYLQGLPLDKKSDPAVVVVDEAARFAVSLLGGHEGGANELAYRVAELTGAVPVITTATETLKPLVLGIGCRKGVSAGRIAAAVQRALRQVGGAIGDVREIVTVDRKAMEPALRRWCEQKRLPLRVIASSVLRDRSWTRNPSAWVRQNLGIDGVCEPCALVASPRGRLLLPKMAYHGVTVAIAADDQPFCKKEKR
jgi:cobalt-precorrin 5A hydrolase